MLHMLHRQVYSINPLHSNFVIFHLILKWKNLHFFIWTECSIKLNLSKEKGVKRLISVMNEYFTICFKFNVEKMLDFLVLLTNPQPPLNQKLMSDLKKKLFLRCSNFFLVVSIVIITCMIFFILLKSIIDSYYPFIVVNCESTLCA